MLICSIVRADLDWIHSKKKNSVIVLVLTNPTAKVRLTARDGG